ncbi:hypothetical protein CfE428DRAFT_1431 [Chthoniobacter flavus Ellin428]|uniref:Uncharacterized protein n=1 Tax=Chthoniobacter flavus Ellin428 TaxID=497964 RepID=B4CXZ0_9BACT|nr:hypothetical protein CfE428DRAFT_1431 [Chthoniobacter flavus Ellin428]TCO87511.1 hypothetical protein EV701_12113 [Chthoniobacter flavus]
MNLCECGVDCSVENARVHSMIWILVDVRNALVGGYKR